MMNRLLFNRIFYNVKQIVKNKHFIYGSSFLSFLFFGVMGLKEFTQIRYDIQRRYGVNLELQEQASKRGFEKKKTKSLEELYDETIEKGNLDDWYNIRGPRPGEDSKAVQDEQRKKLPDFRIHQKMKRIPKFILMTGVTSGIGLSLVDQVVSYWDKTHLVHLCITCRDMDKGEDLKESLETSYPSAKIYLVKMDVGNMKDVLRACMDIKPLFPKLDCIYFNAGIMPVEKLNWKYIFKTMFTRNGLDMFRTGCGMFMTNHYVTEDGINNILATNVVGHFVLFHQMIPLLTRGNYPSDTDYGQVIWTTSTNACKEAYNPDDAACKEGARPYSCSKYILEQLSVEINRRFNCEGIYSHVADPGTVMTNITSPILPSWVWCILLPICRLMRLFLPKLTLTPYNAAQALVWCGLQDPKELDPESRYCSCTSYQQKNYIQKECMECDDCESVFESVAALAERIVAKQCEIAEGGRYCVLCKFFGKRRKESNCEIN